jgi:hypothetical protein
MKVIIKAIMQNADIYIVYYTMYINGYKFCSDVAYVDESKAQGPIQAKLKEIAAPDLGPSSNRRLVPDH